MRNRERCRGSASLTLMVALAFAAILSAFAADAARASAGKARAQAAADASALAAAQELVVPSERTPEEVAADYAERNGARLVDCRCDPGGSDVVVTVELEVWLPLLQQTRWVRASARAVVAVPTGSDGLQPWFAARVACLFAEVDGLSIVSGYRTRAEQAALYREKPHLAAPPGESNHELGLAADLAFSTGDSRRRAHEEAAGCGLEFPMSYEPWHVEPVEL
ncbi:MAG TPA: Rv3654c family TadE-like protein [Actinomycetota bacterium]|nr:Rv3654c family TadE-like protein [Actinomycetota bacterium]